MAIILLSVIGDGDERDAVIFWLEAAEKVTPSVPQVGPLTSVPLYVPSPPSEYAVEPVPAFCELRRGQQTMLL